MFSFLKKPAPTIEAQKKEEGFFSTDIDIENRSKTVQKALEQTFRINPSDLVNANHLTQGYALDAWDCDSMKQTSGLEFLPAGQIAWYGAQSFIGYQVCAIISQNWLVDKACSMPARDAVRNGYETTVNDGVKVAPDILEDIKHQDDKHKLGDNCIEFIRNGRIFGIRHLLYVVDSPDPDYYEKPYNPDGITPGSYKGMTQIDPYWITPELSFEAASNPAAFDFYEPTWWRINGKRYHKSHFAIMRNGQVPDILKPTYLYGGIPVPQKVAERIYAAERTANEAPMLAMTKRLTVMNLDVEKALTNPKTFEQKMGYWTNLMNNFGVKVIGGQEQIQQFDTSLNDLDAVIMTQYQIVAAAADVPATKLLGTTPKGFNASGNYEEASYHEELESLQTSYLTPLINGHHERLIRSYILPKYNCELFHTEANWLPVDSPTANEMADINLKKAQADQTWANIGAVDGVDVRDRLIRDRDSGYNGIEAMQEGDIEMPEDILSEDGLLASEVSGAGGGK